MESLSQLAAHSWNANDHASNLLLINLQKHSDHHARPNKKYQHLQSYDADDAPQLPFGYPLMVLLSLIPQFWMKVMNPKVLEWRKRFYPELKSGLKARKSGSWRRIGTSTLFAVLRALSISISLSVTRSLMAPLALTAMAAPKATSSDGTSKVTTISY